MRWWGLDVATQWPRAVAAVMTAGCRKVVVVVMTAGASSSPIVVLLFPLLVGCVTSVRPRASMLASPGGAREAYRWTSRLRQPVRQAAAIDPDDGFDPGELAILAVTMNPNLRTVRDNRGVAHAQVVAAGLLPNPTVSIQPYLPVAGKTAGAVDGYSGQVSWSFNELVTRGSRVSAAEFAEESVELDIAWSEWSVGMQAELLAYQIVLLKQAQQIHLANIADLESALARIRHAASSGTVTITQLASTEAVLSQARTANAVTNRDLAVRMAELDGLLGGVEGVAVHLSGQLQLPASVAGLNRDMLITHLADRRPDLQAMRMAMQSESAAFQAATLQAFPSMQLGVQVARDAGDFFAVGPTIQIGVPIFSHGQAGRAAAEAQLARLADLFAERSNEARQRIGVGIAEVRGSEATLSILDEAIANQEKVVDIYRSAKARGVVDVLVYYAARTALVQLRLQRISELARLWQGLVQLRSESGYYDLSSARRGEPGGADAP